MKYVIDIDEYTYREAITHGGNSGKLVIAVRNGKPLDNVLDEIRAEIVSQLLNFEPDTCNGIVNRGIYIALEIIDKHRKSTIVNDSQEIVKK